MERTSSYLDHYSRVLKQDVVEELEVREMRVSFQRQVHEWKNILLRGSDPQDLERYFMAFLVEESRTQALLNKLKANNDPDIQVALEAFRTFHAGLGKTYRTALASFDKGGGRDPFTVDQSIKGIDRPSSHLIARIEELMEARIDARNQALAHSISVERGIFLGLVIALFGLAAISLLVILTRLQQQAERLRRRSQLEVVGRISGGVAH